MKHFNLILGLTILMNVVGAKTFAHDFEMENADGVIIYYDFINDGSQLMVTYKGNSYNKYSDEYSGIVVIPESVTYSKKKYSVSSISDDAFRECSRLTSVTIPNSVTTIGQYAFKSCSHLTFISISNSVASIGDFAFSECTGLTSVTIPNIVTSIGDGAFYKCTGLTSIEIPNSVTSIGGDAFNGCSGLTSVTIPNSVTCIGGYAFGYCKGLTSITIPNSVTSIGKYAFLYCTGLTSIDIPNSVTSVGDAAFQNCSGLTSVTVLNPTPVAISQDVFTNRTNATLYVPIGSKSAYEAADYWKEFKEIIEIDLSGIEQISIQKNGFGNINQESATWYTIDGKRASEPQRGLNIIRMSNGKTRKVVIK